MLPIMLAAATAVIWGAADYSGGRASTGRSALGVTVASQVYGVPALLLCLPLVPGVAAVADLGWGAGAGLAGFLGIVLLYRGLSTGAMAVVAPITAVTAAVVPMVFGLLRAEAPSPLALVGGGCALVGIALVSLGPSGAGPRRATAAVVGLALGSGTLFGLFAVLISQTRDASGLWPIVAARVTSIAVGLAVAARAGVRMRVGRRTLPWVVAAGVGDVLANAIYLLAIRAGLLSVVAPIAALYPASTVLLALALDKERLRAVQVAGLGLAATALVLTAV